MKKSKKIFLLAAALFLLAMIWIGYDISSKTTFPGAQPNLEERLSPQDSLVIDSARSRG